ncbi:MAG TPA: 50S ribosomal protein L29 [Candidatus Lokiarchaeia archaeon]|nr:50S ribosomal protein L29 [Candidatus Lokiarchaeia archaeon]
MAKFKAKDVRKLTPQEREKKLEETRKELQLARAVNSSGGSQTNPMAIREARRTIARILTIAREEQEQ